MKGWRLLSLGGPAVVGLLAALALGAGKTPEQHFRMVFRAYDTNIPEATIEGVTIRNVRQFNVLNEPSDFTTRVGTRVHFTLVNESPISENFSIEGHEVDVTLKTNEEKTFSFKATRPGSFTIWCKLHPKNVHLPGSFMVLP